MDKIVLHGVKTHNLKNINIELPRDRFIVITGISGSGKSSLAFDTIYAEGQRRYVESLSTYARQFLSLMAKPDVEYIAGLSPAIAIEQGSSSHNPRSTVGTVTEIHDYLRLLYARLGTPKCPEHQTELTAQTVSQMVDTVLALPAGTALMLLAPVVKNRKGKQQNLLAALGQQGFIRAVIDGELLELDQLTELTLHQNHSIDVVVDRFKVREDIKLRLAESFETALRLGEGVAKINFMQQELPDLLFSEKFACPICDYTLPELSPRMFSFNSPIGACPQCDGLGYTEFFDANKIINPELSLAAGAIHGWGEKNTYYFQLLSKLARHYNFSLDSKFAKLEPNIQKVILYGNKPLFEGIIPNMQRRYLDTESTAVREELAKYSSINICNSCDGSRLNLAARNVFINNINLPQLNQLPIRQLVDFLSNLTLSGSKLAIGQKIISEITQRLEFLINVGLDYLNLARSAHTLSGGEAQRIRLASQIGAGLVGVMYVLDEPSIGLHQRDNQKLLHTLLQLRDLGNTVIVVEHDEEAIRSADHIVDIGPGAGLHGGNIIAQGSLDTILQTEESLTGQYLSAKKQITIPNQRRVFNPDKLLILRSAAAHNLKHVDLHLPLGLFTCITGVSGSGKSSLIEHTLYPLLANILHGSDLAVGAHQSIENVQLIDKIINIDQSPIGRTPRSNPATYTGVLTLMRELFAQTPEARSRGYKPGRFSFNVKGGRCEACQGDGLIKVEMHFLPDVYVTCDICQGQRYNRETLEIQYKGQNIHQVLSMSVEQAVEFFSPIPLIKNKLDTLIAVGLGYICLGQNSVTLSGGEAQRVKLARELAKRSTGKTLYILDEPTTGLHFHDIAQLLKVLQLLCDNGNTVVVIEHNLDVIKTADWIIDLGPEGGEGGGHIIATGSPEQVANVINSYTGQFLRPLLRP
jgi:excinuclease ABC subunit A